MDYSVTAISFDIIIAVILFVSSFYLVDVLLGIKRNAPPKFVQVSQFESLSGYEVCFLEAFQEGTSGRFKGKALIMHTKRLYGFMPAYFLILTQAEYSEVAGWLSSSEKLCIDIREGQIYNG